MLKTIAAIVLVLIGVVGSCTMHRNASVLTMVEQGVPPQDAACAYAYGIEGSNVTCSILAGKRDARTEQK